MNIVFLTDFYSPRASAVGNCVKNLAEYLSVDNDVTVICFKQDGATKEDGSWRGQRLLRVETHVQRVRRVAERMVRSDTRSKRGFGRILLFVARSARALKLAAPGGTVDYALVAEYCRALRGLGSAPDLVVPVCLPFESILAAAQYKEQQPETILAPFVFDQFAASATLNQVKVLKWLKSRTNIRLERLMLEQSNWVLHISWDEHLSLCHQDIAEKAIKAAHPLLVKPHCSISTVDAPGVMVYAGALDPVIRNPAYAFGLLNSLSRSGSRLKEVVFYVPRAERFAQLAAVEESSQENPRIRLTEAVPAAQMPPILSAATWLLSIGNSTRSQHVSKIYEYMSHGKPIVHISSIEEDPTVAELKRYPLSLCLSSADPEAKNRTRLLNFLEESYGQCVDFETVSRIFEKETPAFVSDLLLGGRLDNIG